MQGFKFELMPNGEQIRKMRQFAGNNRFVYNKGLALQKSLHEAGEKHLSFFSLCHELTKWRHDPETPWLADAPAKSQQHTLKALAFAYTGFFAKRTAFPRFKRRGQRDSFSFRDSAAFKLDHVNGRVFIAKLGWIRFRKHRDIIGEPRCLTVSRNCEKWEFSVATRREVEEPIHPSNTIVGVDMGIVNFVTLSDGTTFEPISPLKKHRSKLARYQRMVCRRTKGSKNREKAKRKVSRLYRKIRNVRLDFLHKTSTTISKNHAVVCIEDLQVKNMSASAAGTIEDPGKNVRQKSGLNRSILDQGWAEFRRMLEYKQKWRGGQVIAVNPRNTSRTCIVCFHVSAENRKTQAKFACVECGYEQNADVVGAINILRAGHAQIACGDTSYVSASAQEPTEASQLEFILS